MGAVNGEGEQWWVWLKWERGYWRKEGRRDTLHKACLERSWVFQIFVGSLSKPTTQYSRLMCAYPSPSAQSSSCRGKEDEGGPFCIKCSSWYSRTKRLVSRFGILKCSKMLKTDSVLEAFAHTVGFLSYPLINVVDNILNWIKQQQTRNYEVISLWCSRNIYSHSVELCVGIATVFYIYQVRKKISQNVCYDTTRRSVFRENHLPKHAEGNHSFLSKVLWKAFLEWKGLSIWF